MEYNVTTPGHEVHRVAIQTIDRIPRFDNRLQQATRSCSTPFHKVKRLHPPLQALDCSSQGSECASCISSQELTLMAKSIFKQSKAEHELAASWARDRIHCDTSEKRSREINTQGQPKDCHTERHLIVFLQQTSQGDEELKNEIIPQKNGVTVGHPEDCPAVFQPQHGRLLKARLKPLRPVYIQGPTVAECKGMIPERIQTSSGLESLSMLQKQLFGNTSFHMLSMGTSKRILHTSLNSLDNQGKNL
ncbi:uncharacterized protein LOC128640725 [Bombina bombina]|uniref:uncharacterized protein LOC128640725 n=1 Tax=Bombina bombina TaxID=8345 RepID=UPI00235A712F|nr:uncharacterized protein LOC128640725 [Bombina bombina]